VFVRSIDDIIGTDLDVHWGAGQSRRLIVRSDGMGFAVAETQVLPGTDVFLEYKNHLEACYCIEGTGEIIDSTGNVYPIFPRVIYALDQHDKHRLRALTEMRLLSIFCPPIHGHERHDLQPGQTSSY
jgi:L-ectoine synthase